MLKYTIRRTTKTDGAYVSNVYYAFVAEAGGPEVNLIGARLD